MRKEPTHTTRRARELARILDSAFRIPGTRIRFGLDPVLGLVPGLGDAVGGALGAYLLLLAFRAGAPPVIMVRMFVNVAADVILGSVPLLGDLLDAGYKANIRNLDVLDRYLAEPDKATKRSWAVLVCLLALLLLIAAGAVWLAIAVVDAVIAAIT